jgi:hypothetical protein
MKYRVRPVVSGGDTPSRPHAAGIVWSRMVLALSGLAIPATVIVAALVLLAILLRSA